MHTKTMEGLVGASTSVNLMNTPLRVLKEASQKGDTGTMQRAMGYVNEYSDKTQQYMAKAEKGMKEEAKEAQEKRELERENAIRKHQAEQEELEKRIEESKNGRTDTVRISNGSKTVSNEEIPLDDTGVDGAASAKAVKMEPVIYTKTGEPGQSQLESGANISVTV